MKQHQTRLRPPVKYHGGKFFLSEWIISHFPTHKTYAEPFGGAASVLLNKTPSEVEIYSDLEYGIYNLMRVLKEHFFEFLEAIRNIKYEKEEYLRMREIYRNSDKFLALSEVEQAVITYSVKRMSRGGLCGTFCWSSRIYGEGIPGEEHSWLTMLDELPLICERLKNVKVHNLCWQEIVFLYDSPDTVYYLDPPYPKSTRVFKNAYRIEMTTEQHEVMASVLKTVKGKVLLSSYPSKLYDNLYGDWRCVTKSIPNHSSQEKIKPQKSEVLWMNF
jgi:DNA adenine methylase